MKKRPTGKVLTKLTNYHTGEPVYVDLAALVGVDTEYVDHYSAVSNNTVQVKNGGATRLLFPNAQFIVSEHVQVIIALIEGRDPAPAQIIYGHKS